jgi:hypothetical protein
MRIKSAFLFLLIAFSFSCKIKDDLETLEENGKELISNEEEVLLEQLARKAFSYATPFELDIETGEYFNLLENDSTVIDKNKVREVSIYEDLLLREQNTYEAGLQLTEYSMYNEGVSDNTYHFIYDEQGRLTACSMWTFFYQDDTEAGKTEYTRDVYFDGGLQCTEAIRLCPDGYVITRFFDTGYKQRRQFIRENGILKKVIGYDEFDKAYEWYILQYENANIKSITYSINSESSIEKFENVIERDGKRILILETVLYDEENTYTRLYYFKGHDAFGNWTFRECFLNKKLEQSIERIIRY